jgi:ABC-2 type transport system ATP-binding protein
VSRRQFWAQIHQLSTRGTTIVVTTHYMDEAERCHEIAFIFRGQLLDTGTPREMVQRRGLRAAEASVEDASELAARLRADPRVDEVAHYGHLLRVCTRHQADPLQVLRELSRPRPEQALDAHEVRPTVEDAFVSMVREDLSHAEPARGAA